MPSRLLRWLFHLSILGVTIATPSHDYRQDITQVWSAPMPPAERYRKEGTAQQPTTMEPGVMASPPDFIQQEWQIANNYMYGGPDISFIPDPYPTSHNRSTVMRVLYGAGSYSPKGSTGDHLSGGAEFYSTPFGNQSYGRALLEYDMAVDAGFDWISGGKLPGIYGGKPSEGCSGGRQADGQNCFSIRLMWRENGFGEAYLYIPTNEVLCRDTPEVMCNKHYGVSLSRGRIQFPKEQWTRVQMAVQINDPPSQSNGVLQIWQDNQLVIDLNGLQFRTTNAVAISSLMFSTFFGGSTPEYATPHDTFTYFKNIQFSVADPVELSAPVTSLALLSFSVSRRLLYSCIIVSLLWRQSKGVNHA